MSSFEEYINNNLTDQKEINDTTSFYKNMELLGTLYSNISVPNKLLRIQGKFNSKICFIFKNEEVFKSQIDILKKVAEVYYIKLWDIAILFKDKTDNEQDNIKYLNQELDIVNPFVIYIFDDNELTKNIQNNISKRNLNAKYININNLEQILKSNVSPQIFDLFKYLITYNY